MPGDTMRWLRAVGYAMLPDVIAARADRVASHKEHRTDRLIERARRAVGARMNRSLTHRCLRWRVSTVGGTGAGGARLLASLAEGIGIGLLIPVLDDVVATAMQVLRRSARRAAARADGLDPPDQRCGARNDDRGAGRAQDGADDRQQRCLGVGQLRLGHDCGCAGNVMLHADYAYVTRLEQGGSSTCSRTSPIVPPRR